jgi:hypothetical protein
MYQQGVKSQLLLSSKQFTESDNTGASINAGALEADGG